MSTIKAINVQHPSSSTINLVTDSSGNVTVGNNITAAGTITGTGNLTTTGTVVMGSSFMRNRIINGAMVIDQRNSGAAVTVNSTAAFYPVDRFYGQGQSADGVYTLQQVSDAPSGFTKSLKMTVTTADASIGATQYYNLNQTIEGFNCADLAWGSSSASTITLSFWVKSSLTGTFGGAMNNAANNRSYPFTYTVSSAATWEKKTITIVGDTTGTWATDNTAGIKIFWSFGTGSTYKGTAGSWAAALYIGATGETSPISTVGATWQMTGVQFEVGTVATPFEQEIYSNTLAKCQRYLTKFPADSVTSNTFMMLGSFTSTSAGLVGTVLPVKMRTVPTLVVENAVGSFALYAPNGGAYSTITSLSLNGVSGTQYALLNCGIASGGTAGQGAWLCANGQQLYGIQLTAEL